MTAALTRSLPLLPQTGRQVVNRAKSQLGQRERVTADYPHGNVTPYGAWYQGGRFQGQPWCAIGVSWATAHAGAALPIQTDDGYSWTVAGAEFFKSAGAWLPRTAHAPAGSHVFMSWNGDDIPEHVGLLDAPHEDGSTLWTVEFNANMGDGGPDGVGMHRRHRSVIVGFGVPNYARPAQTPAHGHLPAIAPLWTRDGYAHPTLAAGVGMRPHRPSEEVAHLQRLLLACGRNLVIDGRFGHFTDQAVRLFQHRAGLEVDGVVGPLTWAALHAHQTRS